MTQLLVIAWQAIRSRPWASLALVVTAAVGIASAGVAPLWANAAEDSLIKQAVREAEAAERVVTVLGGTDPTSGAEPAGLIAATIEETVVDASAMPASLARHFDEPRLLVHSAGRVALLKRSTNVSVFTPLAWEDGGCERLTLAAGRCPTDFTEIALSTRTAKLLGVPLGKRVDIRDFVNEPPLLTPPGTPFPRLYRVVGLYRAPDE